MVKAENLPGFCMSKQVSILRLLHYFLLFRLANAVKADENKYYLLNPSHNYDSVCRTASDFA